MDTTGMKKCPYCAEWIKEEAIKCRYCRSMLKKNDVSFDLLSTPGHWHRVRQGKKVAGVCTGIANELNMPVLIMPLRLFFILTTVFYGGGFLIYVILWILMPPPEDVPERTVMADAPPPEPPPPAPEPEPAGTTAPGRDGISRYAAPSAETTVVYEDDSGNGESPAEDDEERPDGGDADTNGSERGDGTNGNDTGNDDDDDDGWRVEAAPGDTEEVTPPEVDDCTASGITPSPAGDTSPGGKRPDTDTMKRVSVPVKLGVIGGTIFAILIAYTLILENVLGIHTHPTLLMPGLIAGMIVMVTGLVYTIKPSARIGVSLPAWLRPSLRASAGIGLIGAVTIVIFLTYVIVLEGVLGIRTSPALIIPGAIAWLTVAFLAVAGTLHRPATAAGRSCAG